MNNKLRAELEKCENKKRVDLDFLKENKEAIITAIQNGKRVRSVYDVISKLTDVSFSSFKNWVYYESKKKQKLNKRDKQTSQAAAQEEKKVTGQQKEINLNQEKSISQNKPELKSKFTDLNNEDY